MVIATLRTLTSCPIPLWEGTLLVARNAASTTSGGHLRPTPALFQAGKLAHLMDGEFSAKNSTFGALLALGDFGLGTFVDFQGGEMLLLGGSVYSMPSTRSVNRIENPAGVPTPFTMVTRFDPNQSEYLAVSDITYDGLKERLSGHVDPTRHYAVLVQGGFTNLELQCVQIPKGPGLKFKDVGQDRQCFSHIEATLVGFHLGVVDSVVNYSGCHLHGISHDKTAGGHVLSFKANEAGVWLLALDHLEVLQPYPPS